MRTHRFWCLQAKETQVQSWQAAEGDFWSQCLRTLEGPWLWHFRAQQPHADRHTTPILTSQQEKGSFTNYVKSNAKYWQLKNINIFLMKLSSFMISGLDYFYTEFF